ncbi:hypothetical protein GQ457_04G014110 [Hibiscus cannabinus]
MLVFFEQLGRQINHVPAVLAETFISLNACRKLEAKEWPEIKRSKWVDIVKGRRDEEIVWRVPWLGHTKILYKCGDYDYLMLLGESVTAWKRKAHDCKVRSYELQCLFDATSEKLTQSQAHVAELQTKVTALSHSLQMLRNQNTHLELQDSQNENEVLKKQVETLEEMVQECKIKITILEDANEGGDDYWFTRLRNNTARFREQDAWNERIVTQAREVARYVAIREVGPRLMWLIEEVKELGARAEAYA